MPSFTTAEHCRTLPNAPSALPNTAEQRRTLPNTAERAEQRLLPIEAIEHSDAAYVATLAECELPLGVSEIVRLILLEGRRVARTKQLPKRSYRQIAQRLNVSVSTVSDSLKKLSLTGLVTVADGVFVLDCALLVAIAEKASERRAAERPPVDPAAALDLLRAPPRSAVFGVFGAFGSGSVEENNIYPVSVSSSGSVSVGGSGGIPTAAEQSERDGCLKQHPAWRALQTKHLRPTPVPSALQAAFYAAVEAGLFVAEHDDKVRFLATAWDISRNQKIHSPAVALRVRVERGACYRFSVEGAAWAKPLLADRTLRRDPAHATTGREETDR